MTTGDSVLQESARRAIGAGAVVVLLGVPWGRFVDPSISPSVVFWSATVTVCVTFVVRFTLTAIEAGEPY